jgi:hypothetical protein
MRLVTTPQADHYIVVVSTSGWNCGLFFYSGAVSKKISHVTKSTGICCEKFPSLEKKIIKKIWKFIFWGD